MDLELKGKAAIVGGGSSGIGYAIAHRLAQEGARVLIWARGKDALETAAKRIHDETGGEVVVAEADIHKPADNLRVVETAVAAFGRLDILINNDGAPPLGALLEFDDAAWQKAIQQNLMSVIRACGAAIPHMRKTGGGRIINITAISARQPAAGFGLSVATWAGLIGYAKTLSLEGRAGQHHGQYDMPGPHRHAAVAARFRAGGERRCSARTAKCSTRWCAIPRCGESACRKTLPAWSPSSLRRRPRLSPASRCRSMAAARPRCCSRRKSDISVAVFATNIAAIGALVS